MTDAQKSCCNTSTCETCKGDKSQCTCCKTMCCKADPRTVITVLSLVIAAISLIYAFGGFGGMGSNKSEPGATLAKLNGKEITEGDIKAMLLEQVPSLTPEQLANAVPQMVEQYINIKLLDDAAHKSGVAKSDEVKKQMRQAKDQITRAAYLRQETDKITDADIDAAYEARFAGGKARELNARHILVADKAKADDLIKQLQNGANFATLAKENTIDKGTASNGGSLGWFLPAAMVKPFADAVVTLKKGEMTTTPVQSQFGWHIIRVEDTRERPAPAKKEIAGTLRQELAQQKVNAAIEALRAKATIERMNVPAAAATAPAAPADAAPVEAAPKAE